MVTKLEFYLRNDSSQTIYQHSIFRRGKVRDVYNLGDQLLIVATDRISAFDSCLPNAIPFKDGAHADVIFWFDYFSLIGGTI